LFDFEKLKIGAFFVIKKNAMKYGYLLFGLLLSCQTEKEYQGEYTEFENVNYVTLTNETTDGGSQIGYLKSGFLESNAVFCFCDINCSRTLISVSELQFNEGTSDFRYKENLSDAWVVKSSKDWCTKHD